MNLNIVPTPAMVAISEEWLTNPRVVASVTRRPMGAPIWDELGHVHEVLLDSRNERMAIEARIATLSKRITRLGGVYNRKARGLRNLLVDLAEATDDPDRAAVYGRLDALLFPHQLRIINMSYWERAGVVLTLEKRVTPEILAELEGIRVGEQSLADIYRVWVEAGRELGQCVQERARVEASLSGDGATASQVYARKVRAAWIHVVRLLLHALPVLRLSEAEREDLLAPLERGVQEALASRARASARKQPARHAARDAAAPRTTAAAADAAPTTEPTAAAPAEAAEAAEADEAADAAGPGAPEDAPPLRPTEPLGGQREGPASARDSQRAEPRPPEPRPRAAAPPVR